MDTDDRGSFLHTFKFTSADNTQLSPDSQNARIHTTLRPRTLNSKVKMKTKTKFNVLNLVKLGVIKPKKLILKPQKKKCKHQSKPILLPENTKVLKSSPDPIFRRTRV